MLQAVLSFPSFALLLPCLLLPESPRWLVSRGQVELAADTWERAAALNRHTPLLPPNLSQQLAQQATAASSNLKCVP